MMRLFDSIPNSDSCTAFPTYARYHVAVSTDAQSRTIVLVALVSSIAFHNPGRARYHVGQ